jgi:hypothetical protein
LAGLNGKDTPEKKNKEKTGSLYNNSVLHLLSPYASPVQHFSFVFFFLLSFEEGASWAEKIKIKKNPPKNGRQRTHWSYKRAGNSSKRRDYK